MNTPESPSALPAHPEERRHDLDALRAFAMLLGIVLHGAMSFIPGVGVIWGVQDSQSNPLYGLLLSAIHGWRMPLFFLVSGFFTAMLWRKRGLRALLVHRFNRVFLPMLLAMVTVIPLIWVVSGYVRSRGAADNAQSAKQPQRASRTEATDSQLENPNVDVFAAVATGDQAALASYLQQGGDVDAKNERGSTPLHVACLFGRADMAESLLNADASLDLRNNDGVRPEDLLTLDWGTTSFIARLVQLPVQRDDVLEGRERIAKSISERTGRSVRASSGGGSGSPGMAGLIFLLFYFPVFHHLWFLWFLCWFVCGFAVIVKITQTLHIPEIPGFLLTSAARYAWLIPLAAVPQYFMATSQYSYGPDTSIGLVPLPAVFTYYAIFFGYGALYFGADDREATVGRGFWWTLPIALLILFPVGLSLLGPESTGGRVLFAVMQVSYTWAMSFAMIGLFHRFCNSRRFWVRYLSDSSYWLYLAHLPLVMLLQFLVRDWSLPSILKFAFVCSVTTGLLLISYQLCVRGTWLGVLLNGRKYPLRPATAPEPGEESAPEAGKESAGATIVPLESNA
ncbi:MAG: acyltransferase family protein [Pirellulaceae bacterium]|nr:acyltransferase family protein [Pirellulaceae bacterium]